MYMKTPKVSVIITTYNRGNFLKYAVDSVLSQTFQDFEIIIIDDGSTDNTRNVVSSYKDSRIFYYYQSNKGQNPARNIGMKLSKGAYIAHLDSDDLWEKTKLEKQVRILDKNNNVGLVYCGTRIIDSSGNFVKLLKLQKYKGNVLKKLIMYNFLYNGSNTLFRKECLDNVKKFDESINRMTDWEFYLKLSLFYEFYSIKEYLVSYRIHGNNMSVNYKKYEINGFKILFKIFKNEKLNPDLQKLKTLAFAMRYRFLAHRCLESNNCKQARQYALKSIKLHPHVLFKSNIILIYLLSFLSCCTLNILRKTKNFLFWERVFN